jgi:hypothetical protein
MEPVQRVCMTLWKQIHSLILYTITYLPMHKKTTTEEGGNAGDNDKLQRTTVRRSRKSDRLTEYKPEDYEPLPRKRGAIRLLKLMPNRDPASEVHCKLITPKESDYRMNKEGDHFMKKQCDGAGEQGIKTPVSIFAHMESTMRRR